MRRLIVVLLAIAAFLVMLSPVLADEEPKYNFASAQGSEQIRVVPGDENWVVIYFYNIDGNRITHITLEISEAPDNWEVEIEPAQHEIEVEIGGAVVTVIENLHIEPSEVLSEELPEDMVCITIPGRGYALAKPAHIVVRVPNSEATGATGEIVIAGEAEWLEQSGSASIKQARDFEFSVTVVSEATDSTETILDGGDNSGFSIMRWLPAIIAGAIVLLGAILIPRLVAKKKRGG